MIKTDQNKKISQVSRQECLMLKIFTRSPPYGQIIAFSFRRNILDT